LAARPRAGGANQTSLAAKHIRVPGLTVRQVQGALREARFDPGPVDNKIGQRTIAAIRQFQAANGLTADGVVGRRTWELLSAHEPAGLVSLK
jgi:peptidoglycan hydrolase-like protein with peptidoglycan-binding domain